MRIYRIAAMFKTFGFEEKIIKSFQQHYRKVLGMLKDPSMERQADEQFAKNKEVYFGAADIADALRPIIEHYGDPKIVPNEIHFIVAHPDLDNYTSAGSFVMDYEGGCWLTKVATDFKHINFDSNFERVISHEVQHFIKAIYKGSMDNSRAEGMGRMDEHFADEWEIQAHAMTIAKDCIGSIRRFIEVAIEGRTPERADQIKASMQRNKMDLLKSHLPKFVKEFFKLVESNIGEKFSPELRRQYYEHSYRDFNSLFDEMIASI